MTEVEDLQRQLEMRLELERRIRAKYEADRRLAERASRLMGASSVPDMIPLAYALLAVAGIFAIFG